MSVLSSRLIDAVAQSSDIVITRLESKKNNINEIGTGKGIKSYIWWDCARLRIPYLGRYNDKIEILLFKIWIKFKKKEILTQISGDCQIMALCGSNISFLVRLQILVEVLHLSYSIYVVDDFSESLKLSGKCEMLNEANYLAMKTYAGAQRVYSICPGMNEHIWSLYGRQSIILYPISDKIDGFITDLKVVRGQILYVGSLNLLYLNPLHEVAKLIDAMNALGFIWTLHMITRDKAIFEQEFSRYKFLTADHNCSRNRLRIEVQQSEVLLLPYSFSEKTKIMVETSFPSKFMDAVCARKPIICFAPAYASISRHLNENGAGYHAESTMELANLLKMRPWDLDDSWMEKYNNLQIKFHSEQSAYLVIN